MNFVFRVVFSYSIVILSYYLKKLKFLFIGTVDRKKHCHTLENQIRKRKLFFLLLNLRPNHNVFKRWHLYDASASADYRKTPPHR